MRSALAIFFATALAVPLASGHAQFVNKGAKNSKGADAGAGANGNPTGNLPLAIPVPSGLSPEALKQLTPEQLQTMMLYRALQSRSGGQVRRGIPQFIPLGMPGMMPYPQATPAADAQADTPRKSSLEKRIAARKAAEEKKRAAREAKKAKAKQKGGAKKAKADKNADADNDASGDPAQ
jgi:hypothetical protein